MREGAASRGRLLLFATAALLFGRLDAARADDPAAPAAPAPGPEVVVGVVTGDQVNLRVGPRMDDAPVTQVEQGTLVLVVERSGDWLGVRVPAGFAAAIASPMTEVVDDDHVRIAKTNVNLRVRPPSGERAYPAFRDHPEKGTLLPVISREADWIWIEAPEEVRAYVNAKYVKELGPLAAQEAKVAEARAIRTQREKTRQAIKRKASESTDEETLRAEVGAVSQALSVLRAGTGYDRLPVVELSDRLSSCLEAHPGATDRTKALAKALSADLEREIELRVAWSDELLARARTGQPATPRPDPAPKTDAVEATGVLRFLAVKGAAGGGEYVLWTVNAASTPAYVVRKADGLKDLVDQEVRARGKTSGARALGLPILEAAEVSRVAR